MMARYYHFTNITRLEFRNDSDIPLWIQLCKSNISHSYFVHVGTKSKDVKHKGVKPIKVNSNDYEVLDKAVWVNGLKG